MDIFLGKCDNFLGYKNSFTFVTINLTNHTKITQSAWCQIVRQFENIALLANGIIFVVDLAGYMRMNTTINTTI